MRVRIPFGSGNNLRTGYIIEMTDEPGIRCDPSEGNPFHHRGGRAGGRPSDTAGLWMKEHYGSTMIKCVEDRSARKAEAEAAGEKRNLPRVSREEARAEMLECERKHQRAKARVLQELIEEERLPQMLVARKLNISPATFRSLRDAGLISINSVPYYRNPVKLDADREEGHRLSRNQQDIVDTVTADYDNGTRQTYLLRGNYRQRGKRKYIWN